MYVYICVITQTNKVYLLIMKVYTFVNKQNLKHSIIIVIYIKHNNCIYHLYTSSFTLGHIIIIIIISFIINYNHSFISYSLCRTHV